MISVPGQRRPRPSTRGAAAPVLTTCTPPALTGTARTSSRHRRTARPGPAPVLKFGRRLGVARSGPERSPRGPAVRERRPARFVVQHDPVALTPSATARPRPCGRRTGRLGELVRCQLTARARCWGDGRHRGLSPTAPPSRLLRLAQPCVHLHTTSVLGTIRRASVSAPSIFTRPGPRLGRSLGRQAALRACETSAGYRRRPRSTQARPTGRRGGHHFDHPVFPQWRELPLRRFDRRPAPIM